MATSLMTAPAIAEVEAPPPTQKPSATASTDPFEALRAEAKKQNKRVEIPAYRSEYGTFYANPDGRTMHAEVATRPVWMRAKDGTSWLPVDPTLVEKDGVIQPKAVKGDLVLSPGGDTMLIKVNGEAGPASIATPNKLPKPEIKGSVATYRSAYGKGLDLVITVTPSGFTQEIVIRERPGSGSRDLKFRIPVKLPKGSKFGTAAGKPALLNAKGKQTGDVSSALMVDAAANANPDTGKIGQAPIEVEHSAAGDSAVVAADSKFLADPAVTYPVTVQTASETWTGTGIDGDTHVSNVRQSGKDNAGLTWSFAGRSHSGSQTHRAYFRFNIKGTPLEGGTVSNADLRLFNYNSSNCSDTDNPGIELRQITSSWDIQTLTWNTQPRSTTEGHVGNKGAYSATICPEGEGELYYSIEQIVQGWMNGTPDLGVVLKSPIETEASNWRSYRMFEYGGYDTYPATPRGPVLFIEYTPVPAEYLDVAYLTDSDAATEDTYEADQAQVDSGTTGNEPDPTPVPNADEVRADSLRSGVASESELMEQGHPDGLTDEQIEQGSDPNRGDNTPPTSTPTPHPTPTGPTTPDKILNENPYFETAIAPWTGIGGLLERSTDRAHEANGQASARVTTDAGASETTVRSEGDIPVSKTEFYTSSGWFYSPGKDQSLHYGIEWLDQTGQTISSSLENVTAAADTWTQVETPEWPPADAVKARLTVRLGAQATATSLYMDELMLLGPGAPPPVTGNQHTITIPLQADMWIDNEGGGDAAGEGLWAGAWSFFSSMTLERSYLRFDTTAISGKAVVDAKLQLWNNSSDGCGDSQSGIKTQQVTTAWTTDTVSWSNQPASTTANEATAQDPGGCTDEPGANVAWSWPITGIAQAWAAGEQNNGLVLRGVDESATAPVYDRGFLSSRGSTSQEQSPTLTVTYVDTTTPTPTPTPPSTGEPDVTPPSIVETSPSDEAQGVPADTEITVHFSEAIKAATLTLVDQFENVIVPGRSQMSQGDTVLTFTPSHPLDGIYNIQLSNVSDVAGNVMPPYSGIFSTGTWSPAKALSDPSRQSLKIGTLRVRGSRLDKGKPTISSVEPYLLVNVERKGAGRTTVEVEVAHDPDAVGHREGTVWDSTVSVTPGTRTVSFKIPPTKLKKGWGLRWRARASAGGATGAWSEWSTFRVEASEKRSTPVKTMDELPSTKSWPEEIKSWSECTADNAAILSGRKQGWLKNRFNWCQTRFVKIRQWVKRGGKKTKIGEVKGWLYLRTTAALDDRKFSVFYRLDPTLAWGTLLNPNLQLLPYNTSSSGNPTTCAGIQYGVSNAPLSSWGHGNGDQDWDGAWEFHSRYLADPRSAIEQCVVSPHLKATAPGFNKTTKKNVKIYVRCDSSAAITWYGGRGGCVVMMGVPIMHLSRNDVNEKGDTWPEQYDHIYDALYRSMGSYPLPGGVNFPGLPPNTQKRIPGDTAMRSLTRLTNSTAVNEQRTESSRICHTEIRKTWPGSIKKYGDKALNCDEFPFASTYQGSLRADPAYNFSVRLINGRQNQKFGSSLGAWFQNNRILDGDSFMVNMHTPVRWT
ncbi:DNRLRE domain-containing protein [Nonomuraea aurantiaca]|uniref:DNRLRE domain-containing protein n=1 Tax=Nonomuraea aurantiaca TaxID=2878562 RepID=UPI001CD9FE0B|nr:DNRLRE domain-containing protein [Nonomuraea aurantiaca]MCA2225626.1 DNRLRE domain-containing protein [Nonomuraea aurantiaca]